VPTLPEHHTHLVHVLRGSAPRTQGTRRSTPKILPFVVIVFVCHGRFDKLSASLQGVLKWGSGESGGSGDSPLWECFVGPTPPNTAPLARWRTPAAGGSSASRIVCHWHTGSCTRALGPTLRIRRAGTAAGARTRSAHSASLRQARTSVPLRLPVRSNGPVASGTGLTRDRRSRYPGEEKRCGRLEGPGQRWDAHHRVHPPGTWRSPQ
jgi:hypothetical protein